jgi:hypothetical protein
MTKSLSLRRDLQITAVASVFSPRTLTDEDFHTYFNNTFVFLQEKDYKSAVLINEIFDNHALLHDLVAGSYVKAEKTNLSFSLEKPEEGFYSLDDDLMYVSQISYRGVLKGFGNHCIEVLPLCDWKKTPMTKARFIQTIIKGSEILPTETVWEAVSRKEIFGAPISRTLAISQGYLNKFPTLWSNKVPIASVVDRSAVVLHDDTSFKDEIENVFKGNVEFREKFPKTKIVKRKREVNESSPIP